MANVNAVCSEDGLVSAWTITHFLTGYMWCLVWMYATDDFMPWLNLLLYTILAVMFEILENLPSQSMWMWGWLGYTRSTYAGDAAINSASDVLFALIGWAMVRGIVLYVSATGVLMGILLGVAAALYALFLCLLRIERRVQGIGVVKEEERPALTLPA